MWSYIALAFIMYLIGFWFGAHYGVDSCSKNIEDTVILKDIKEGVLRSSNMSDEGKLQYLEVLKEQLKSISI